MRVGTSSESESARAATEAVEAALDGAVAALVIVFVAPFHDMHAVATAANAAAGGAPLVGCSTSGEIGDGVAGSGRIVAIAIGGAGLTVRTSVGPADLGPEQAGAAAAQGLVGLEARNKALILLSDGLKGHHAAVVRGAYLVGGAGVKLVGGCAGDELAMTGTWQIHGGVAHKGAVVGAAIGSEGPLGIGVGHGWKRTGAPRVVTESDGQHIFRLDDQPALDRYLSEAGVASDEAIEGEEWPFIMLQRPFGIPRPGGDEVRAVLGADAVGRSLLCGDVPQGALISMMTGNVDTVLGGTVDACADAIAGLGGVEPIGVVAFDCAGRRSVLGEDGLPTEMAVIAEHLGAVPVGGFYTYGEVARKTGSRGVHSATLVLLALG
jgi:hypothetical protein